jgi:hypothetical protein
MAHQEQASEAIRIPPAPDANAATVAARVPAQVAVDFHRQVFRNRENSHLTSIENPLPYGCG